VSQKTDDVLSENVPQRRTRVGIVSFDMELLLSPSRVKN